MTASITFRAMHTGLTKILNSIYQRTPLGIARVCVAGVAGALFAIISINGYRGVMNANNWYVLGGVGLILGLGGGVVLGYLEHREEAGKGPPVWWLIGRRILSVFMLILALCLFLVLMWVMLRICRENHLYGF